MSKNDDAKFENEEVELNSDLLDQFTGELEKAINKVCADNPEIDPRLELLVTLGLLASQVAQDSSYSKKETIDLMSDLFDDVTKAVEEDEDNDLNDEDEEVLFTSNKKGSQFNLN